KDPYGLYSTFLIDKGSNDGIQKYMPVLGIQELVGRVIEVYPEFSRVRTIESPKLAFGAVVRRTNELGVYMGARKDKTMTYLSINSDISPGDEIITSGTTDITPAGLRLGKVKEVVRRAPEEDLVVKIESSENIAALSHVWILTRIRNLPDGASLSEGQS
ncbi:rod shape-determining protein MreC, partial [bacterium]|nr:rod shape-determining protein MreC [bacterium]MBU1024851.1 rod shape-determining protein MreC [bacterium]